MADRDALGRMVREGWVRWAQTQPSPKSSHLVPYDELDEAEKEADRQIGEQLFAAGRASLEALYDAAQYTLDRMQRDPEFRWHMLGTETFDRCVLAEAAFTGRTEDEVRAARMVDLQPVYRRRKAECAQNRARVRQLEGLLEEHDIDLPSEATDG